MKAREISAQLVTMGGANDAPPNPPTGKPSAFALDRKVSVQVDVRPAGSRLWTCSRCGSPIKAGQGYIVVLDDDAASHPIAPQATSDASRPEGVDESHVAKLPPELRTRLDVVLDEGAGKSPITFSAYHGRCDPRPGTDPYWIAVEEAESLEAWCTWVGHLIGQACVSANELREMLGYWFANRGAPLWDPSVGGAGIG